MRNIIHSRQSHGFSLVEVLAGMLILGIGLIGVAKFQTRIMQEGTLAKQQNQAVNIAEAKLESLRFSYTIGDATSYTPPDQPEVKIGNNTEYSLSWTITESAIASGQVKIEVTVNWLGPSYQQNPETQIMLAALASDFDPNLPVLAQTEPPAVILPTGAGECVPNTLRIEGDAYYATNPSTGSNGDTFCTTKSISMLNGDSYVACKIKIREGYNGSGSSGLSSTGCGNSVRGVSFSGSSS